jgi:hypothetical protein
MPTVGSYGGAFSYERGTPLLRIKIKVATTHSEGGLVRAECVQGNLVRKNMPPPSTLQKCCAYGPVVVLGGGRLLMRKVPL